MMDRFDAYVGAGAGWYGLEDDIEDEEFDDDNGAFRLYAGGKFNDYIGLEGGYVNFGELDGSDAAADATFEADGFEIAALGYWPLGQFSPYVKVGQLFWNADTTIGGADAGDDDNDTFFGIGGQYDINESFSVRLEADRYQIADADVDSIWASAQVNF